MFDTHSVYALNKLDRTAIVCPSAAGDHIRLSLEDFSSEEEFARWKAWSDEDYRKTEAAGQKEGRCCSLDVQRDTAAPSAEDAVLEPYMAAEAVEQRRKLLDCLRSCLTEKQYRRMCLYYLDGKTEAEIAALEGVKQQRISKSLLAGTKIVEKFFREFSADRG